MNGDNLTGQVWVGGGLVRHMPMSPERAAQQAREDEREARQAAFEAELRADQALERRQALEMAGVVPRTPFEVAEAAHAVMDRADERNERQRAQNQPAVDTAEAASWRSMRARLAAERSRRALAEYDWDTAERAAENGHAARRRAEQQADTSYRSQQYFRYGGSIIGGPFLHAPATAQHPAVADRLRDERSQRRAVNQVHERLRRLRRPGRCAAGVAG